MLNGLDIGGVYVSRDLDTLFELIQLSESSVKDGDTVRKLGVVLGYPKCCIDKYIEEGALKAWHRYLYSLIKEKMDKGTPPELWAIYHAPCSPKCRKSLKLGLEYLESVNKFSRNLFQRVIRGLCSNHLSYSHGKRFIDYKKADVSIPKDFRKLSFKLLSKPRITASIVLRPYVYFRWLRGPYRLLLDRDILGLKYITRPGKVFSYPMKILKYQFTSQGKLLRFLMNIL